MIVTIFTPTFNRAGTLPRLYESLKRQTNRNFEWIVIDDGSSDNSFDILLNWQKESDFNIQIHRQKNSGKHVAINKAVKLAKGEYFYIVDSDDFIPEDAVDFILKAVTEIHADNSFVGISGLDKTIEGDLLTNFPKVDHIDATSINLRHKLAITGDMAEVFKTELFRNFPFPEIEDEKFCPEALVWNRIASAGLKIRYYPKVLKIIEYLPDGLTASIVKVRLKSPVATSILYSEWVNLKIPLKNKVREAINYWRFLPGRSKHKKAKISIKWWPLSPMGFILHLRDTHILKNLK